MGRYLATISALFIATVLCQFSFCVKSVNGFTDYFGFETSIEDFPHQASILRRTEGGSLYPICAGAIIHKNYIVTAASCIAFTTPLEIRIQVGSSNGLKNGILHEAESYISHPNTRMIAKDVWEDNIALIRLRVPLDFTKRQIAPISIRETPLELQPREQIQLLVTGWNSENKESFDTFNRFDRNMFRVSVNLVPPKVCDRLLSQDYGLIPVNILCAIIEGIERGSSCAGDLGGPMIMNVKSKPELVGIVTRTYGCDDYKHPSVYTNVSYFASWIKDMIKN